MGRHAGIQKVGQRGSNFDNIFLVDKGREDPSTTISGLFRGVPMMALY